MKIKKLNPSKNCKAVDMILLRIASIGRLLWTWYYGVGMGEFPDELSDH